MATLPPYFTMEEGQNVERALPPPITYNSRCYRNNKLGGKTCCRFILCFSIFLFLLILNLMLIAFYLFTVSNSQVPSYTVDNLEVQAFDSLPNSTFTAQFLVTVKVDNPNGNIAFVYGEDSSVNVVYDGTDVCSGKLPHFDQGPMNVTTMTVQLVGKGEFGSGLQEVHRKNMEIPLLVKVKVPVRIVAGEYPLREFMAFVNCSLLVDSLAPQKKINILSSNTTFDYQF